MTSGRRAAARLVGRRRLRHDWRAWLGLTLVVGVAGGGILAAATGARRTSSAYDRLLAAAAPFDFLVTEACETGGVLGCRPSRDGGATDTVGRVLDLPPVADGAEVWAFQVPVSTPDGRWLQPDGEVCFSGSGEVDLVGSTDGSAGTWVQRPHFIAGGPADPARADQVVVSEVTARRVGIEPGDHLSLVPVDACDAPPEEEWPPPIDLTVTGVQRSPGEVEPATGLYLQSVTVTPPLFERLRKVETIGSPFAAVRLRPGATRADLEQAIRAAELPAAVEVAQDDITAEVRRRFVPDTNALWLVTAVGTLAMLVMLSQALVRQAWAGARENGPLRALGATTRDLAAAAAVPGLVVGAGAAVVAVAVAVGLSPLTIVGDAQRVEVDAGLRVDSAALALGAVAVGLATFGLVVAASVWVATRKHHPAARRPSLAAALATWTRARPTVASGARLALEPGRGASGIPVRSGVACTFIGAVALIGSLTFAAGLDHLLATPRLVGVNWELTSFDGFEPPDPDGDPTAQFHRALARAGELDGVAAAGFGTVFPVSEAPLLVDGPSDVWMMSLSSASGVLEPTIVDGRAPAAPDEIVLGTEVVDELGIDLGDRIAVQGGENDGGPPPRSARVEFVGTVVLPLSDGFLAHGAVLTFEGLDRIQPGVEPQVAVFDLRPGTDPGPVAQELEKLGFMGNETSEDFDVVGETGLEVRGADLVPRLLGGLMAVVATGVLAHLVFTTTRARRRELATLRVLGFTGRQVRASVGWQATTAALVALLPALVVGVAAGRVAWTVYARGLDVVVEPVIPWVDPVLVLVGALVVAGLVAFLAGRGPARSIPAVDLRAE